MKRLLPLLVLTFALSLVSHAAQYYTGVWYSTKSTYPGYRQSGQFDIQLLGGGELSVDVYYNGVVVANSSGGNWYQRGSKIYVVFTDTDGWNYKGALYRGLFTGTFISATRLTKGKWQANNPEP